jgi:hypothetical protein
MAARFRIANAANKTKARTRVSEKARRFMGAPSG